MGILEGIVEGLVRVYIGIIEGLYRDYRGFFRDYGGYIYIYIYRGKENGNC